MKCIDCQNEASYLVEDPIDDLEYLACRECAIAYMDARYKVRVKPGSMDSYIKQVQAALPFTTDLWADMGEDTGTVQIDLEPGKGDDPHSRVGLDLTESVWWIDLEVGTSTRIVERPLAACDQPADVAAWITATWQARSEGVRA